VTVELRQLVRSGATARNKITSLSPEKLRLEL
jgi:hypothetical protein